MNVSELAAIKVSDTCSRGCSRSGSLNLDCCICTLRGGGEGMIYLGHAITRLKGILSGQRVTAVKSVTAEVANAVWRMQCSHPKCRILEGIHEMDESEVQQDKGPAMR
jgi:hypothetical protein